ncbi:MAG: hypothetical protein RBR71_14320 [Gudongella sp.]|nr:hypothetical protein [Gudongella sp.]
MTGYEKVKRMAKALQCNTADLLVLARQNDPFYVGSPTERKMAEWFAELWRRFGYSAGIHLRRIHYQLVSQEDPRKHNGKPYENTENDWAYLCNAGKYARYLGLVDPEAFVDRRNPDPHVFREYDEFCEPPSFGIDFPPWEMPNLNVDLVGDLDWSLPAFVPRGYEYSDSLQPYHIEVWVEKSTMNDVLVPLCERYGVNLVTGLGFMSITSVIDLLKRINEMQKPCRIFYISDFDPAGDGMPTAVARQIEYWLETYAPAADIKLTPIVLTRDQVEQYRLPRTPVKDSDRRKNNFEERYGEGAVELDALEALYPGKLARIVKENIMCFWDTELQAKMTRTRTAATKELNACWEALVRPFQNELDEIRSRVEGVVQKYQMQLDEISEEMAAELEPYEEMVNSLWQAIQDIADSVSPDLPDLPEPEVEEDDRAWLFDSRRDYFDQLTAYRAWKGG